MRDKENLRHWRHEKYLKNRQKIIEANKKYYNNNKEKCLERRRKWRIENIEHCRHRDSEHYYKNKNEIYVKMRVYRKILRLKALVMYSGSNPPHCACCGESEIRFLTFDHIDGSGYLDRKLTRNYQFILRILKENDKSKYQVLCMNCNHAKGSYGICPHQEKIVDEYLDVAIKRVIGDVEKRT